MSILIAFLRGEVTVRVRGSEVGGVRVRILDLSSITEEYSSSLSTSRYSMMRGTYVYLL